MRAAGWYPENVDIRGTGLSWNASSVAKADQLAKEMVRTVTVRGVLMRPPGWGGQRKYAGKVFPKRRSIRLSPDSLDKPVDRIGHTLS